MKVDILQKSIHMIACVTVSLILSVSIIGCNKTGDPKADGDTTVTSDFLMMEAYYSPGGEITEEERERLWEKYRIFSTGEVVDKNDRKIKLTDKDFDNISDCYRKFCKGKVKSKKIDAQDCSSYDITVYDKDREYVFSSDGSEQSESVEDIFGIISPYFAE